MLAGTQFQVERNVYETLYEALPDEGITVLISALSNEHLMHRIDLKRPTLPSQRSETEQAEIALHLYLSKKCHDLTPAIQAKTMAPCLTTVLPLQS
jgi:hypothetical protein